MLNAKSLQAGLQAINVNATAKPEKEADDLRKSIKNQKGLQDLFQKDDESECKVFRLPISAAIEVYSDFRKNKFLDARLLAILENTYIFKTFKPSQLKSIALDSELRK